MTGLHGRRSHVPASPPYWNLRNQWSCICYYYRWEIWTLKLYKNSWLCLIKSLRMFLASLLAIKQDLGIHSFAHSSLFHSSLFHSLLFTLCSSLFHSLLFALSLKITRLKERPCAIRSRHSLKRVTCWRAIRSCSLFKKSDVSYLGVFLSLFRAQNTNALLKTNLFFFHHLTAFFLFIPFYPLSCPRARVGNLLFCSKSLSLKSDRERFALVALCLSDLLTFVLLKGWHEWFARFLRANCTFTLLLAFPFLSSFISFYADGRIFLHRHFLNRHFLNRHFHHLK